MLFKLIEPTTGNKYQKNCRMRPITQKRFIPIITKHAKKSFAGFISV